jgi:dihydrolipoamide dehydrogenase
LQKATLDISYREETQILADTSVIVIGGGTAGFLSAQIAAQHGGKVMIVEREKVGGICPNWGCIPMCFMDHCVEVIRSIKEAANDGINTGGLQIDYNKLIGQKQKVVGGIVAGMEARLQATGVKVVIGSAKLTSPDQVEITYDDGKTEILKADKIIVSSGSTARRYDVPGAYGAGVLTTKELLDLKELPKSLAIIGRSVTALELATVWVNLGSEVTLIARKPRLLPNEDEELAACIRQALEDDGVRIYDGVDIESIDDGKAGKVINISGKGGKQKVEAQFAVFALGQQPRVDGLGLENAGIAVTGGAIAVNERMETSVKGIYATGDATGGMMLASLAMIQGMVAGTNAMGGNASIDYRAVPRSVRTVPPLGAVGITESEAKEKGLNIKVGRFPFEQNPRAGIIRESRGFVKIIADAASGEILGVHIVGPQAPELIHEATTIMQTKGTARDIAAAIHVHPSLHETIQRVAQGLRI